MGLSAHLLVTNRVCRFTPDREGVQVVFVCAGVYALINLMSASRRRELGIRLALGANRQAIFGLMLKDTVRVVGFGAGAGLAVTLVVVRVYRAFLFGVTDFDPSLKSAAPAIVILLAVSSALLPAWRASRLDPGSVLRGGE